MDVALIGLQAESRPIEDAARKLDQFTVASKKADSANDERTASSRQVATADRAGTAASRANAVALQAQAAAARSAAYSQRVLFPQLLQIGQATPLLFQAPLAFMQQFAFQSADIAQIYAGRGGVTAAISDSTTMIGRFAARLGPVGAVVGILGAGFLGLRDNIRETTGETVTLGNVFTATMQELSSGISSRAAPAVAWLREDFSKLTSAIIEDVRVIGDTTINGFEAAYNVVTQMWGQLPEVFGYLMFAAAQNVLNGLNRLIQMGVNDLNSAIELANRLPGANIPLIGDFQGFQLDNPFAETVGADLQRIVSDAFDDSPMTEAFARIGRGAIQLANETDEASRSLNGFESAVQSIQRATEGLWAQGNFFGEENRYDLIEYQKTQELLNAAMDAGVRITGQVRERISGLASEYVSAVQNLDLLKEAQERFTAAVDFSKQTFSGFFSDFNSQIQQGASVWDAFKTAGMNALSNISNKLIEMATSNLFMSAFGGSNMIGGGGGLLSGLFGSIPGFATGTNYAPGGLAMVGERGPELVNLPRGSQVIPNHQFMASNSNYDTPQVHVTVGVDLDASGNIVPFVTNIAQGETAKGIQAQEKRNARQRRIA